MVLKYQNLKEVHNTNTQCKVDHSALFSFESFTTTTREWLITNLNRSFVNRVTVSINGSKYFLIPYHIIVEVDVS